MTRGTTIESLHDTRLQDPDVDTVDYLLDVAKLFRYCPTTVQVDETEEILEKYLETTNKDYTRNPKDLGDSNTCFKCNEYFLPDQGLGVCQSCGACSNTVHLSDVPSFKERQEIEYKPRFTYDKMTHLADWLNRFQSNENKSVPPEILVLIKNEIAKERIKDYSRVTEEKVKRYLKRLKLSEYYDNTISIINRLIERPKFVLPANLRTKLEQMFSQIQIPFQLYKAPNRKNFLSYPYFLHKFFLILKLPEFSQYFPLLKSPEKLRQQDEIFIKIVRYMKNVDPDTEWEFYPSF